MYANCIKIGICTQKTAGHLAWPAVFLREGGWCRAMNPRSEFIVQFSYFLLRLYLLYVTVSCKNSPKISFINGIKHQNICINKTMPDLTKPTLVWYNINARGGGVRLCEIAIYSTNILPYVVKKLIFYISISIPPSFHPLLSRQGLFVEWVMREKDNSADTAAKRKV